MMCRNLFYLTVVCAACLLGGTALVQAQDLSGYQPPDMFGAATPKQVPVAPEAVPQPQAAPKPPANPPVYKATPVAKLPADVEAEIGKVNPKPLTNALMGIDNKASPPPMPTIANEVVPKPDMTPTADGEKPKITPAVKQAAPVVVEKPVIPTPAKPPKAEVKMTKVAVLPMRKPPVPSFMRPKTPVKTPAKTPAKTPDQPVKPASTISTEIAQAKPMPVEAVITEKTDSTAAAPVKPAPPIIAEVDSNDVAKAEQPKPEAPKPVEEAPKAAAVTAPAPVPAPAPTQTPAPAKKVVAEPAPQATLQMLFVAGDASVGGEHQDILTKQVITRLQADAGMRLQIIAYATAVDDSQSSARRVSLSRALAVRDFLKDAGVAPYRMDIRALGSATTAQHVDRVDLLLIPAL